MAKYKLALSSENRFTAVERFYCVKKHHCIESLTTLHWVFVFDCLYLVVNLRTTELVDKEKCSMLMVLCTKDSG